MEPSDLTARAGVGPEASSPRKAFFFSTGVSSKYWSHTQDSVKSRFKNESSVGFSILNANVEDGPKVRAKPPPSLPAPPGAPDAALRGACWRQKLGSVRPRGAVLILHVAADEDEAVSSSKSLPTGRGLGGRERGRGRGEA